MRALFTALCRLLLRIFFRRIESVGEDRVPADAGAPVLYVINHPNALLDPLFILCQSPRPVTFLAKAPLFSTFLVKHFIRAFECLPVYRAQDGAGTSKNRASIEASIALLASGKALALFPEGVSHSEPKLQPLKTGAARIALSASAPRPDDKNQPRPVQVVPVGLHYSDKTQPRPVQIIPVGPHYSAKTQPRPVLIIPVGLHYSAKTTFRSDALIVYGEPVATPVVALDARDRPPESAAEALTDTITAALGAVTLQAQTHEAADLARAAARLLAAASRDAGEDAASDPLAELELERRLVEGYERLREREGARVDRLVARMRALEAELARMGVPDDQPLALERRRALRFGLSRTLALVGLAVPALIGVVVHFVPYRVIDLLVHPIARRHSHHDEGTDLFASLKLIAGFLFFLLTWLLVALALALIPGVPRPGLLAALSLVLQPACGYAALRFMEIGAELRTRTRAAWVLVRRRDFGAYVASERAAIRDEILALAELL